MLFLFALHSLCIDISTVQSDPLDRYTDSPLHIYDSVFSGVRATVVIYAPSPSTATLNIERTTFYDCYADRRAIFDLTNNILFDFNMVCFSDISSRNEGTVLDYTDTLSGAHTHKLSYLSLDYCRTTQYWIFKIYHAPVIDYNNNLEFRQSNISRSESHSNDRSYKGIIQISGYYQDFYHNHLADNKCYYYGLIYETGDSRFDMRFDYGKIDECNFIGNTDSDNTQLYAQQCNILVKNCHFLDNSYGTINSALWSDNSAVTISGNYYDSNILCGAINSGSYPTGDTQNVKQDNQNIVNFLHYHTRYCKAQNPYPPIPTRSPIIKSLPFVHFRHYRRFMVH